MAKERNGTSENEPLASSTDEAEVRPRRSRGRRERGVRIQEASRIREPGITDPNEVEQFKRSSDNKNSKMTLLGVTSAFNLVQKVSDRIAIQKKQGKLNIFSISRNSLANRLVTDTKSIYKHISTTGQIFFVALQFKIYMYKQRSLLIFTWNE